MLPVSFSSVSSQNNARLNGHVQSPSLFSASTPLAARILNLPPSGDRVAFSSSKAQMEAAHEQLLREIRQQPQTLRTLIDSFPAQFDKLKLPEIAPKQIFMVGVGSSKNAPDIAADYISMMTGLPVRTFTPEAYESRLQLQQRYQDPSQKPAMTDGLIVAMSQSGKSAITLRAIESVVKQHQALKQPAHVVSITNSANAKLAELYGNHLYVQAGDESSIAATKSMTNSILGATLFGLYYGQKLGRQVPTDVAKEILDLPSKLDTVLQSGRVQNVLQGLAGKLKGQDKFVLLSAGALADALPEAALKMTETSANIVMPYHVESFKHGPKVILDRGMTPIYILPPSMSSDEANQFFSDMTEHVRTNPSKPFSTTPPVFLRFENSPAVPASVLKAFNLDDKAVVTVPATEEFKAPLESTFLGVVTSQLLSAYLAEAKGVSPNHPALGKVVVL